MDKVLHLAVMVLIGLVIVAVNFEPDVPSWAAPWLKDAVNAAIMLAAFLMNPTAVIGRMIGPRPAPTP
ncbi:MAG TPA: hypothetical protein VMS01_04100 [Stellaceae bacterium]|nr:hypothetical protein [Stellaceae bacterium]